MKIKSRIQHILSITIFFCLVQLTKAQNRCGSDQHEQNILAKNPTFLSIKETKKYQLMDYLKSTNFSIQRTSSDIIKIPVVVHLIGTNVINVSYSRVLDQINILNQDYGKLAGTNGFGNGVDTKIQFCLASTDPFGLPTNGIISKYGVYPANWNIDAPDADINSDQSLKFVSHWPEKNYLNLYVVDEIVDSGGGGVLGYATFPWSMSASPDLDGVVIGKSYFGITPDAEYNSGRTATHEVGHWLGLLHTFQDGCPNGDCIDEGDQCCDTPPVDAPNFNCIAVNSCPTDDPDLNDQIQNYMDYTPDLCMNMFSQNQSDRIFATLHTDRHYTLFSSCAVHCENGFQDADETGIDCGGIDCLPCSHCENEIQDADETGLDCGGLDCAPCSATSGPSYCRTVQFTINNLNTNLGVINVCDPNVILRPYSYNEPECAGVTTIPNWEHITVTRKDWCGDISDRFYAAYMSRFFFDQRCYCKFYKIFLGIQECNENNTPIAPEANHWFYIFDGNQSDDHDALNFKGFYLYDHLPAGYQLYPGKYYKIKIAGYSGGIQDASLWKEHNSFIRIYEDNLLVQNNNITHDQFANILTMQNSNVPSTSDVKIVAKTQINIQQETILSSGRYYIENFDCTTLDQFRGMENGNTHNENTSFSEKKHNLSNKRELDNIVKNTFNKSEEILIYPNPTSNNLTIESQKQIKELFIYNSIGTIVLNETSISSNKLNIDLSQQSKGIYLIKIVDSTNKLTNKKIIKN